MSCKHSATGLMFRIVCSERMEETETNLRALMETHRKQSFAVSGHRALRRRKNRFPCSSAEARQIRNGS
jgi:hypothetical protein